MPLNRHSTAIHAYVLMMEMKPGDQFDIPADTLSDMQVPLDHPLDRMDTRYVVERLQRWLPFKTEVLIYADSGKTTFRRITDT